MVITFTLQAAYSGATYVAGPFNISGTTNTGTVTQLATGLTKTQLLTGYTITGISDATTGGTINSTGTCSNSIPWLAANPTSTPTPTPTSTPIPGVTLTAMQAQGPYQTCTAACSAYNSNQSFTTFYITEANLNNLTSLSGTMYNQNIASASNYASTGWYYHNSGYMFQILTDGEADPSINLCNVDNSCGGSVIN